MVFGYRPRGERGIHSRQAEPEISMLVCLRAAEGTAVRVGITPPLGLCHSLDCVAEKAKILSIFKRRQPVAILSMYLVVSMCVVSVFIHIKSHNNLLAFNLISYIYKNNK